MDERSSVSRTIESYEYHSSTEAGAFTRADSWWVRYGVGDNYPSPSEEAKLRYDIVGRALADIGDPSIPAIADILSRGDVSMRKRAFFILANITSPVAEQAMRDHLPNESEPTIRKMIQQNYICQSDPTRMRQFGEIGPSEKR